MASGAGAAARGASATRSVHGPGAPASGAQPRAVRQRATATWPRRVGRAHPEPGARGWDAHSAQGWRCVPRGPGIPLARSHGAACSAHGAAAPPRRNGALEPGAPGGEAARRGLGSRSAGGLAGEKDMQRRRCVAGHARGRCMCGWRVRLHGPRVRRRVRAGRSAVRKAPPRTPPPRSGAAARQTGQRARGIGGCRAQGALLGFWLPAALRREAPQGALLACMLPVADRQYLRLKPQIMPTMK